MNHYLQLSRTTLVACGVALLCGCAAYERAGQQHAGRWQKYQPSRSSTTTSLTPTSTTTPTMRTPLESENLGAATQPPNLAGLGKPAAGAEILTAQRQNLATISTPKRIASQEVTERGLQELQTNHAQKAVQTFQDALSIDGTNGAAYFYLAKAHYQLGAYERALAMLDRASSLLGEAGEWLSRIDNLKVTIERAMSTRT